MDLHLEGYLPSGGMANSDTMVVDWGHHCRLLWMEGYPDIYYYLYLRVY